jgi:excinuclease ABC subunit C
VSDEEYQEQLDKSVLFLNGRSHDLLTRLADDMESAAAELEYEKAAEIRDQISQLQNVQATQNIEGTRGDLDLMAVFTEHGHACVQVLFVREARVLGSRSYYPQIRLDESPEAILEAFLAPVLSLGSAADSPGNRDQSRDGRRRAYLRRRWEQSRGVRCH